MLSQETLTGFSQGSFTNNFLSAYLEIDYRTR